MNPMEDKLVKLKMSHKQREDDVPAGERKYE